MIDIKDIQKTIEAVEALLPVVKNEKFKASQEELLSLGKAIIEAYEKQGDLNEAVLIKLNRGTTAMLESVLVTIESEKTLQTKKFT
jgi:hypothetical protein